MTLILWLLTAALYLSIGCTISFCITVHLLQNVEGEALAAAENVLAVFAILFWPFIFFMSLVYGRYVCPKAIKYYEEREAANGKDEASTR